KAIRAVEKLRDSRWSRGARGNGGRGDTDLLRLPGGGLAQNPDQQSTRAHSAWDPPAHPCGRGIPGLQSALNLAAARLRHIPMVDQEIPEHRAAEGSADERRHHRLSQRWDPLSPNQSAKNLETSTLFQPRKDIVIGCFTAYQFD